ncbi:protein of unknown function [Kyrpidia spormannii]|uniref:Uncharacterized protein n=1 Tax=Kyrpidia spormannii TaxID=2055160 RepID=A0ACA8ZEK2_9BACL|nr:protein of unknown function [Kyrpidia spormannii]
MRFPPITAQKIIIRQNLTCGKWDPSRRSWRILKPIEKIVIDANALLSIVIGGKAAQRIVLHLKAPELLPFQAM